jgi:hypothetical protein
MEIDFFDRRRCRPSEHIGESHRLSDPASHLASEVAGALHDQC